MIPSAIRIRRRAPIASRARSAGSLVLLAAALAAVPAFNSIAAEPAAPPRRPTAAPRPAPAAAQRTAAAQRPRTTMVDPAVTPAGGGCRQCGPSGCRHGHAAHGHHRDCRDGKCAPYCPVRPATFGFYGTQWRRWPGQGVVQTSAESAATPVKPPRSAVPGADEESRGPGPGELPEPDATDDDDRTAPPRREERLPRRPAADEPAAPAPDAPAPAPDEPDMEAAPPTEPALDTPAPKTVEPTEPAAEPGAVPRGDEKPADAPEPKPSKPRPEDEDLFDESAALHKVRRRIAIAVAPEPPDAADAVQPAAHANPGWVPRRPTAAVPRVPFDPAAESKRLNQRP